MRVLRACLSVALLVGAAANVRAEALRVSGRVVAPDGIPLAGVPLELTEHLDPLDAARLRARGSSEQRVARAITDDAGRYALDAPQAGVFTLVVVMPGFVPLEIPMQPLVDSTELDEVRLEPDAGLQVRVLDAAGAAVAGATVTGRVPRRFDTEQGAFGAALRQAVTGPDGTARVPRGDRERLDVEVACPGYGLSVIEGQRGTALTVRLERGVRTGLVVVGRDDRPLAGADVFVGSALAHAGTTDDAGRLAVALRRGEATTVAALAADGRRARRLLDAPGEGATAPLRIVVPNRHVLVGRVIDAETRRAVPGAVVWDVREAATAAATDRAGAFALGGEIGRLLEISAAAPGYMPADPLEIHLLDDGRPGLTLPVSPAAAIEGEVVDTDGRAVTGAEVVLSERRQSGGMMRIQFGRPRALPKVRTDGKGRFRLSAIDPLKSWDVRATADGFAPAESAVAGLEPRRTTLGVRLTLSRGRSIAGTVVDRDGAPIRDAAVKLTRATVHEGPRLIRVMDGDGGGPAIEGSTGDDGRFVIRGLSDGKFDVEVRHRGFAPRKLPAIELGKPEDAVDVGKLVLDPGESLQGYVRARGGAPIEGADIFLRESTDGPVLRIAGPTGGAPGSPDAVSDPAGFFAVPDLAPERRYSLEVRRRGYVEGGSGDVELPRDQPIEVVLEPASDIAGRVVDQDNEGVPGARLALKRMRTIELGGNVARTIMINDSIADGEGRFVFEDEEPGPISLTASAPGYQEATLDNLAIPAGEDVDDLVLPLALGAIVEGRVVGPDGRAAIGASVRAVSGGPEDGPRFGPGNAAVDGDGYYRLDGLAPGKTSIEATHERYPRVVRDLDLHAGKNPLDLTFEGGTEVAGVVRDTGGTPVGEARVTLVPAGRYWGGAEARSSADGTFRIPGVTPGSYRFRAEATGYAPASPDAPIEVTDQPIDGLAISLARGGSIAGKVRGVDPRQLADVSIEASGGGVGSIGQAAPDYRGDYRVEQLPPGRYSVQARIGSTGRQTSAEATVEGDGETRLDLEFGLGVTLSGIVLSGEVPVSGATLFVEGTDVEDSGLTRTDHAGHFTLEGLDPGTYRVDLREFTSGLAHTETIALASSREVTLRLPANRVAGRVVDAADRQPLAGVTLTLGPASGPVGPPRTATTDVKGQFTLTSVPDGDWRLTASRKGYAAQATPVAVTNGQSIEDLRVALDATEGLLLEVRLPSGAVPSDVQIAALDAVGAALVSGMYATGENGSVRLSSVPPGEWTVLVSAPGAATATAQVRAPGPKVLVTLRPATALRVEIPALSGSNTVATARVRDASGQPFRSLGWSGSPRGEWPVSAGQIEFGSLPPDSWTVEIAAADGRTWHGTATTSPGAPASLVLE